MYKYLAIFLILLASGSVVSQEQEAPEFDDDDFIEFIYDSLTNSIFEDWKIVYMEGFVEFTESGEIDARASYFYTPNSPYDDVQLFVSNSTAILNAISYIKKNAQDRGENWNSFKLEFYPDESHQLTTW